MNTMTARQPLTNTQIERRCRAALRRAGITFRTDRQHPEVYVLSNREGYEKKLTVRGIFSLVRYTETVKEKRALQRELLAEHRTSMRA